MASTQILLSQNLQDLNPILAGWSFSDPGAQFQPEVINYTLLHYVASGHGKILTADGSYAVCAGQAFWIFPGDQVTHVADRDDPWVLRWVGFTGSLSHDFSQLPRVFSPPKQTLPYLKSLDHFDGDTAFELAADLLLLYTKLVRRDKIKPDYVQFVMDYVQSSSDSCGPDCGTAESGSQLSGKAVQKKNQAVHSGLYSECTSDGSKTILDAGTLCQRSRLHVRF